MAVVWTSDAYASGTFSAFQGGLQRLAADRATVIAPPAEVGGGPQNRAFLGKYRILSSDTDPIGTAGRQRVEAFTSIAQLTPYACQENEVWLAWETYFGDPAVVAETNAYRPKTNSASNIFVQFHQAGGSGNLPATWMVDARVGTTADTWRFMTQVSGGTISSASYHPFDCGQFTYGWHEFRAFVRFDQGTQGRCKTWIDGVVVLDYSGPIGLNPDSTGGVCNYLKQGMYRSLATNNMTVFHGGTRMGTTEADVLAGGGTEPPPDPTIVPDANTRERRFGKTTVGASRSGFSADNKRGSKFATGLGAGEEADVYDLHMWIEGMDSSAGTQNVTLGIYDDDGTSGQPGTKLGEVDQEITMAGNAAADWVKVTSSSPIRVAGSHAWLVSSSGAPSNRLRYAYDTVTNALAYTSDAYEVSPPRMANPFGAVSLGNNEVSICADYDVAEGTPNPPGDTTAPVLQAAFSSVLGDEIVLGYNEPLLTSSVPAAGDYVVTVQGLNRPASSVSISGSDVHVFLSTPVEAGDVVTLNYNRAAGREVKDLAGNLAVSFQGRAIENQTASDAPPFRLTTKVRITSIARTVDPSKRIAGLGGGGI